MTKKTISIIFYVITAFILFMGILIGNNASYYDWSDIRDIDTLFEVLFEFIPAFLPYLLVALITFFIGHYNGQLSKNNGAKKNLNFNNDDLPKL